MQPYSSVGGVKSKSQQILGPPPTSGTISVYVQKLSSLAFVTLCSVVFWGHQANLSAVHTECLPMCRWHISLGVFASLYGMILLIANYMGEKQQISRDGWFTHGREVHLILVLVLLWTLGVVTVSTKNRGTDGLMTWFAWLSFFGSVFATFKAYHSFKEMDLPTVHPDLDGNEHVYG